MAWKECNLKVIVYFGPYMKCIVCPNFNVSSLLAVVTIHCSLFQKKICHLEEIKGGLLPSTFRGDIKAQLLWIARITLLLLGGFESVVSQISKLTGVALSILLGVG